MDNKQVNLLIEKSGLKRSWIADKLGISYQSLWNKLNGKTDFTVTESAKLKEILHLDEQEYIALFFTPDVSDKKRGDE